MQEGVHYSMGRLLIPLALFSLSILALACGGGAQSPTVPPDLPLEKLVIAPGERLRISLPPDQNASPDEARPLAYIEFVVTGASGQPVRATVAVDGQITYLDASKFLLVMPDPSKTTILNVSAPGFEPWELGVRFNLKHTRRFQFPITLQAKPD